jgi:hypothetical protein
MALKDVWTCPSSISNRRQHLEEAGVEFCVVNWLRVARPINRASFSGKGKKLISSANRPYQYWGPVSLHLSEYGGICPWG